MRGEALRLDQRFNLSLPAVLQGEPPVNRSPSRVVLTQYLRAFDRSAPWINDNTRHGDTPLRKHNRCPTPQLLRLTAASLVNIVLINLKNDRGKIVVQNAQACIFQLSGQMRAHPTTVSARLFKMVIIGTENLDPAFLDCALNIYLRVGKRVAALVQNQTSATAPSLQLHRETVRNRDPFDFIPINSFCRIPICQTPKTGFRRCDAGALDPALARGIGQVRICSAVPARKVKFDGSADNRLSCR